MTKKADVIYANDRWIGHLLVYWILPLPQPFPPHWLQNGITNKIALTRTGQLLAHSKGSFEHLSLQRSSGTRRVHQAL